MTVLRAINSAIFFIGPTAPSGPRPPHYRGFSVILRHYNRQDSSERVFSPTQRTLLDNTQHSHEIDFHNPGGIRTRNPNKRAAADPRLTPRGHQDRRTVPTAAQFVSNTESPCMNSQNTNHRFIYSHINTHTHAHAHTHTHAHKMTQIDDPN